MLPPLPPNQPLPPTLQRFYVAAITAKSAITANPSEVYLADGIANSANPSGSYRFFILQPSLPNPPLPPIPQGLILPPLSPLPPRFRLFLLAAVLAFSLPCLLNFIFLHWLAF